MKLTINVKGTPELKAMFQEIGRQAPFALSQALNNTANEAQKDIQNSLDSPFTLRRKLFVKRTIFREGSRGQGPDFASKVKPVAIVRVNPAQDFLAKFEDGERKTAREGSNIAIPLPAVRKSPTTVIRKNMRPKALLADKSVRRVTTPRGTYLVKEKRAGGGMGKRTDFLYKLQRSVPIRPVLKFHATAEKAIDASFVRHALAGIDRALKTAR